MRRKKSFTNGWMAYKGDWCGNAAQQSFVERATIGLDWTVIQGANRIVSALQCTGANRLFASGNFPYDHQRFEQARSANDNG